MMLKSGPEEDVPCFRVLEIWKASGCYQMVFGISMLFFRGILVFDGAKTEK